MKKQERQFLYARQADIFKAVAHPLRIAVMDFLRNGEQCVCDITRFVGSEQSNVSRHLSLMVAAGVLESRKQGLKVLYKIKTPCILNCFSCIIDVIRTQAEENRQLLDAI
ncbi:MAG: winged helix-turn-helix transcriptional regulator [Sedimentisphaerales bacterium]|nr:winged helix-turn-helix transcriptional regulator [Sedimentisphaerales bacterium]